MKKDTYYHGNGNQKWGIYNSCAKEFQFGISESSPFKAENALFKVIGNDARKWRFEARLLPKAVRGQDE